MTINQYILFRVEAGVTYDNAAATAVALGGTLAAITDQAEETYIESYLAADPLAWSSEPRDNALNGPWIGLTQAPGSPEPGGGWGWATGEAYSYSHWHTGQPDNFLGDNRALIWNDNGEVGWADHVNDPVGAGYGAVRTGLAEIAASVRNLTGTAGHDMVIGGAIGNKIKGQAGDDILLGNGGRDNLNGGSGNDSLYGGEGNDVLLGGGGADKLSGGTGDDTLVGGAGQDHLWGDEGADTFQFVAIGDSSANLAKADVIEDFNAAQDVIDLSQIDAIPGGADDGFTYVTSTFTAAGQLRLTYAGADTVIELNTDADKVAEMRIVLHGVHLGISDLTLVL